MKFMARERVIPEDVSLRIETKSEHRRAQAIARETRDAKAHAVGLAKINARAKR